MDQAEKLIYSQGRGLFPNEKTQEGGGPSRTIFNKSNNFGFNCLNKVVPKKIRHNFFVFDSIYLLTALALMSFNSVKSYNVLIFLSTLWLSGIHVFRIFLWNFCKKRPFFILEKVKSFQSRFAGRLDHFAKYSNVKASMGAFKIYRVNAYLFRQWYEKGCG